MAPRANGRLLGCMIPAVILVLGSVGVVTWRASLAATPFFRAAGLVLAAAYVAWYALAWYVRRRTPAYDPAPGAPGGRRPANHLRRIK